MKPNFIDQHAHKCWPLWTCLDWLRSRVTEFLTSSQLAFSNSNSNLRDYFRCFAKTDTDFSSTSNCNCWALLDFWRWAGDCLLSYLEKFVTLDCQKYEYCSHFSWWKDDLCLLNHNSKDCWFCSRYDLFEFHDLPFESFYQQFSL